METLTAYGETLLEIFPIAVALFAAIGGALLSVLLLLLWRYRGGERRYANRAEGVPDLLLYDSVVDDGVILSRNGSLLTGWEYTGADVLSLTNTDRNTIAKRLNAAFLPFGSGWMIHADVVREKIAAYAEEKSSHFPDAVSAAIDRERRAYFEAGGSTYGARNLLIATWFPPYLTTKKFIQAMMYDGEPAKKKNLRAELIDEFKRETLDFEGRLQSVFKLRRLRCGENRRDELLSYLHQSLTGDKCPVYLPEEPVAIDLLIGGQELFTGILPNIGGKYIQTLTLHNFPMASYPQILERLSQLPCEYRWSNRFIFLDKPDALKRLEKAGKQWKQKERGLIAAVMQNYHAPLNEDSLQMQADVRENQTETESGLVSVGYYSGTVVLFSKARAELAAAANYIKRECGGLGFPAQVETVNNLEAFLGSLPGHGVENLRAPLIHTLNFAHYIPSSSLWLGEELSPASRVNPPLYPENSPCLLYGVTHGASPFRLNLHVRDLGHTIIFGPTGAGKSVLLATLAAQFLRYPRMTIFYFDKGMSVYALCAAVNGQHYEIGKSEMVEMANGELRTRANYAFCPLKYLDNEDDVSWAAEWLEALCKLGGMRVTAEHRNIFNQTLKVMRQSGAGYRSLEDFHTQVPDLEIKEFLTPYTKDGQFGYLLAADDDELNLTDRGGLCVFEIEQLMNLGDDRVRLPVLLYLFRRIEKSLKGQPAAIILDEAWLMLGHEVFRAKIREWLKVLRKANCAVIMATQSLSDAANSGILDVINESTATKIFLPNPYARGDDARELYRRLGLNSQQIRIISEALPKRQYYYVSENGNRLFELALGELQLALLAVSDKESVQKIQELRALHGGQWLREWLRLRGVSAEKIRELSETFSGN